MYIYIYIYIYRAVCVLSCVDVIQFFTYVLHVVILDVTKRHDERVQERSERQYQQRLTDTITKKNEMKTGTSGCGSFVVPYFQPATSIDCLHLELGGGGDVTECICTSCLCCYTLYIYRAVSVFSCVDIIQSFSYICFTCCYFGHH